MSFTPRHFGLYFTPDHVAAARRHRDEEPFRAAWHMLQDREQRGASGAQWCALRWRLDNDTEAGETAARDLLRCLEEGWAGDITFFDAVRELLVLAQAFETLREHPALVPHQPTFFNSFGERVAYLNSVDGDLAYVDSVWRALLNLVTGIVFEDDEMFNTAAEVYRQIVRDDIHPQGYIGRVVEQGDGGGLLRQLLVVEALVLMAEAASHVGVALWDFNARGVSVMTAFTYLLYYYFYPEKWRWDASVTNEPFGHYGGFLELVNHRAYPKDLRPILEDLRPIYDSSGGGLTTLTHGIARRRGLFGR